LVSATPHSDITGTPCPLIGSSHGRIRSTSRSSRRASISWPIRWKTGTGTHATTSTPTCPKLTWWATTCQHSRRVSWKEKLSASCVRTTRYAPFCACIRAPLIWRLLLPCTGEWSANVRCTSRCTLLCQVVRSVTGVEQCALYVRAGAPIQFFSTARCAPPGVLTAVSGSSVSHARGVPWGAYTARSQH
jgi:hypothetical protein